MSLIVNTGWSWLDILVYIISGGSFLYVCYLLPRYYRDVIKPLYTSFLADTKGEDEPKD